MPIDRLKPLFPAGFLVLSVAQAAGAELPDELIDCRALSSAVARLDCYDQLVDAGIASTNQTTGPRAAEEPAPATAITTAPNAQTRADISQEDLFGKNEAEIRKSVQQVAGTEIEHIEARVTKVRTSGTGKAVITLDNGQVWIQIDSSRARLSGDDKVTIRRASLGSFMLYSESTKTTMRVKRIS
jgi:hypothetical protein